jgi:hypothetical protein
MITNKYIPLERKMIFISVSRVGVIFFVVALKYIPAQRERS